MNKIDSALREMPAEVDGQYARLRDHLAGMGKVLVAFSGGVDSSLLLAAAVDALGDAVVAVTASSATYPTAERERALALAGELGVRLVLIESDEMADPRFRANPPDRCYHCKRELFRRLVAIAAQEGCAVVVDGSNHDDRLDYRPGQKAVRELGIRSPLAELEFGKAQIRAMARRRGLPNWDQPACACLASRIPYGEEITPERLTRVGRTEEAVRAITGFRQVRVRDHGTVARIELSPDDIGTALTSDLRQRLSAAGKAEGYLFVCLDLDGYRIGSLNEALAKPEKSPEPRQSAPPAWPDQKT